MSDLFRVYDSVGPDGYPPEWHSTIKHLVREQADHRCVRCGHPYRTGAHPMEKIENGDHGPVYASWTPCDASCRHAQPIRVRNGQVEALARILTVHHLNGDKTDCRWWNLAALCQRCHLTIQGRVQLGRVWPWEHSDWFKPYAAGWYAWAYLGEDLDRGQVEDRLDELLALERIA